MKQTKIDKLGRIVIPKDHSRQNKKYYQVNLREHLVFGDLFSFLQVKSEVSS